MDCGQKAHNCKTLEKDTMLPVALWQTRPTISSKLSSSFFEQFSFLKLEANLWWHQKLYLGLLFLHHSHDENPIKLCLYCSYVVITGGADIILDERISSTELLEVSQPNPQWRIVEELALPVPMDGVKGITLGSEFLLSGGYLGTYGSFSDKVFTMKCDQGQCQLEEMTTTLQEARANHIFIRLPASLAKCDWKRCAKK